MFHLWGSQGEPASDGDALRPCAVIPQPWWGYGRVRRSERVAEREGVTYEKEALRLKKKFEETEEEVKKLKV